MTFDEVIHRLWPTESADELVRRFRHTLDTGESYNQDDYGSQRIDRGGTEYYEWRINRIPLPDGRFGVVCYFRDVSAQVRVREEIERSEARFRAFVTATSDVIFQSGSADERGWRADRMVRHCARCVWPEERGRGDRALNGGVGPPAPAVRSDCIQHARLRLFVFANDELLKMWGKTREEAFGKTCLELGYESWHAEMHDREIEEVLSSRRAVRGDVPFNGTAGRRIYDYIFVPVVGANGEVELVAGTTRDVTDRKRTEEELRRVNKDLEQFTYSASHDLKEPRRTVKIYRELLGARYREKLDGKALDFLENVQIGADRMEALVRDLLRTRRHRWADKPSEPADATAVLEAALANSRRRSPRAAGRCKRTLCRASLFMRPNFGLSFRT